MKTCVNCSFKILDSTNYCPECGSVIPGFIAEPQLTQNSAAITNNVQSDETSKIDTKSESNSSLNSTRVIPPPPSRRQPVPLNSDYLENSNDGQLVGSKNEPVVQQKNGNEISPHKIVENRPINRGKSKSIAALLGFLFGTFGVHRLYLGNWGIGLLIPAAWMFSAIIDSQGLFFIVIILIVVDIVRLITLSDHEFNAKYNSKEVHPFQFIW